MILKSRYGDEYFLQEVSDGTYHGYFGDYCRIGLNLDGSICYIDPSGGPFIAVGFKFSDGKIVKSIDEYKGTIIISTC